MLINVNNQIFAGIYNSAAKSFVVLKVDPNSIVASQTPTISVDITTSSPSSVTLTSSNY